jgi:hypothetical protein
MTDDTANGSVSDDDDKSVGRDIIEGLSELCEAVRNKVPLNKKFTVRTVRLINGAVVTDDPLTSPGRATECTV